MKHRRYRYKLEKKVLSDQIWLFSIEKVSFHGNATRIVYRKLEDGSHLNETCTRLVDVNQLRIQIEAQTESMGAKRLSACG